MKLEFNLEREINYSVEQLWSNFFGLKKIHAKHNAGLQATGNVKLPEAPKHWEVFHSDGDRQGRFWVVSGML
jgi:endo-1,4-beta-mannosidase